MNNNTKEANAIKYDEINEQLVIVCHCSTPVKDEHKQLYYVLKYNKFDVNTNDALVENGDIIPLGNKVSYVNEDDIQCPKTDKWRVIADNSKTYVWGVHCPIFETLLKDATNRESHGNKTLTDILLNAYRVLIHDGEVIFNCPIITNKCVQYNTETDVEFVKRVYSYSVLIISKNMKAFMKSDDRISSKYRLSIQNTKKLVFLIGQYNSPKIGYMTIFDLCVIFTKIDVLHGGMSAKKRNNTQKNKKKHKITKHKITKHKITKNKTQNNKKQKTLK